MSKDPAIQFHSTPGQELMDEFLRFFGEELKVLEDDLVRLGEMTLTNRIALIILQQSLTFAGNCVKDS
jgi:hypothetical protein